MLANLDQLERRTEDGYLLFLQFRLLVILAHMRYYVKLTLGFLKYYLEITRTILEDVRLLPPPRSLSYPTAP